MASIREQLENLFAKILQGTVTREEGTMLINSLARKNPEETIAEISDLINNPPQNMTPQVVFQTIAITRNRKFFDVLTATLDHKDEAVSIFACEELATYFKEESKFVLEEHLNNESYNVRKSSAVTLQKIFGDEGINVLVRHILAKDSKSHYHRLTSAEGLLKAGKKGVDAMIKILNSGNSGAIVTIADVLGGVSKQIGDEDVPKIVDALINAGDAGDFDAVVALLKTIASLGPRVKPFEWYVRAYEDNANPAVAAGAKATLNAISPQKPQKPVGQK
ncbi:MAG: hypothetical protein HZB82_05550 [Deltaproteobacteria bacterium]|nr:hypothetical protein [Deltaproteobacteria bacterium]